MVFKRVLIAIFVLEFLALLFLLKANANAITNTDSNYQTVYIKKGTVSTISFDSNINYFLLGDELIAQAEQVNQHTLMVYGLLANESTNLNVATVKSNYVFMLKTLDYNNQKLPNLHINVNEDGKQIKRPKAEKTIRNPNYDYNYSMYTKYSKWIKSLPFWNDGRKIAPNLVWTDGIFTYLSYKREDGSKADIPTVLEVISDIDTPVDFTIKDEVIVVHAVAKKLTLKSGKYYVCVEYVGSMYETNQ